MTNLYEMAKAAAKTALGHLLDGGAQAGEAHLTGAPAGVRASTLDEDLDLLLLEIQQRRGLA